VSVVLIAPASSSRLKIACHSRSSGRGPKEGLWCPLYYGSSLLWFRHPFKNSLSSYNCEGDELRRTCRWNHQCPWFAHCGRWLMRPRRPKIEGAPPSVSNVHSHNMRCGAALTHLPSSATCPQPALNFSPGRQIFLRFQLHHFLPPRTPISTTPKSRLTTNNRHNGKSQWSPRRHSRQSCPEILPRAAPTAMRRCAPAFSGSTSRSIQKLTRLL
jgi:hypothetical protein